MSTWETFMRIGVVLGTVGGLTGLAAFWMEWKTRGDRRYVRRREIPRLIGGLEADHADALRRLDDRVRANHNEIGTEANSRGMYHSSFRENAQADNQREGARDRAKLERDHEREVATLRDELKRLE